MERPTTHRPRWTSRLLTLAAAAAVGFGLAARLPANSPPDDKKPARPEGDKPNGEREADDLLRPAGPASKPATNPADPHAGHGGKPEGAKKVAAVTPEVRALLDRVRDAYRGVKTLKLAGTITGDIDLNGLPQLNRAEFTASYKAPGGSTLAEFRHQLREQVAAGSGKPEMKESMLVGSTGKKLYVFDPKYKYYYLADLRKERTAEALGKQVAPLLEQQNLSLLLAAVDDASAELLANVDKVEKAADVTVGDATCPAVRITAGKELDLTVAFDPRTHLVRRVTWDHRGTAEARKQQDIKKVLVTVDYATTEVDADVSGEAFAWAPPVGARDVTALADAGSADGDDLDARHQALIGKPAPDVKLKGLDGVDVRLADLKGQVVLLDFWATWCGPCRESLAEADALHRELSARGLRAFAVNKREGASEAKAFVEKAKLGLPILLDPDGKVSDAYAAAAIPQAVVIDKEGKVKAITVGSGRGDQVREAVEEAMK